MFVQLSFLHKSFVCLCQINQWKSCIHKCRIRIQCHPICVGYEPAKDQFICLNSPNLSGTPTNQGSILLSLPTQYVCNLKVNIRTSRIDTTLEHEGFSLIFYLGSKESIVWKVEKEKAKAEGTIIWRLLFAYFLKELDSKLATPNYGER